MKYVCHFTLYNKFIAGLKRNRLIFPLILHFEFEIVKKFFNITTILDSIYFLWPCFFQEKEFTVTPQAFLLNTKVYNIHI